MFSSLRPPSRALAALIAIASMLFMQLAIAGYSCSLIQSVQVDVSDSTSADAASQLAQLCHDMQQLQPNLCHAYDHAAAHSLDKPASPLVQPFVASALVAIIADMARQFERRAPLPEPLHLARNTAPPLAIQHCCFRI